MPTRDRHHRNLPAARALAALAGAITLTLGTGTASAMDTFFVGARGQGMAGSLTAAVDDTDAQYYNPAAFGFFGQRTPGGYRSPNDNNHLARKDFGLGVDAGAGIRMHGEMAHYLDTLADANLDDLTNGIDDQQEAQALLDLTTSLGGIDDKDNAFLADVNGGVGTRVGSWGLGVRVLGQSSGRVTELDTQNLGIDTAELNNEIQGNITDNTRTVDQLQVFTDSQHQDLSDAGLEDQTIADLDYLAEEQGLTSEDTEGTTQVLADVAQSSGSGTGTSVSNNQTVVTLQGFGVAEVPLSYGHAINDHWSVGGNLKIMRGRVYGNQVRVFDNDSGDTIAKTDEEYKETTTVGADLGLMGRYEMVNVGLMARNLNSPTFEGFRDSDNNQKYEDVTLDPQVRAGVAFIPHETVTLAVDYDITANETVLRDYDTQFLSGGFEWDILRVLALRAGAYKNLAEDDIGVVYTAGLGLNLWAVRADVAAAMSPEETTVDGDEIPREVRATAEVTVDF
ncbi:hypothetical protein AN478_10660 [Thiohalorhabdus denitrificans]|uniref:Plasmid transfer operon, TraF, protein n=1 Tax=Thiohalorhabdus denitrificans TaxID=381306 RepID=A0A0P9CSC5_9GAMM|nr:conjugal transfer protein TraF [Thiohalorhabdus denitrificans]KPV39591.1 hypothetical protein AN478_10660 [Thiohalorhabdus denitrificans]SCX97538.1 plasmid transfer operon, TraF, protein [Thiohalorhabdus denitrificans]